LKTHPNKLGLISVPIELVLSRMISRHVRIGCKKLRYVDLPFNLVIDIVGFLPLAIGESMDEDGHVDHDKLYIMLSKLVDVFNKDLHNCYDLKWLKFYISRLPAWSRSKLIIFRLTNRIGK